RERDINKLQSYYWPGNVRELENVIERQVITADDWLELDLPGSDAGARPVTPRVPPTRHFNGDLMTEDELRELEKQNVRKALEMSRGRVFGDDGAAALLGIKPTTLTSRLKKLKLEPRHFQDLKTPEA